MQPARMRRFCRPLTVELWYPAAAGTVPGGQYQTVLRDGTTVVTLYGQAARDAGRPKDRFRWSSSARLIPAYRMLMAHLAKTWPQGLCRGLDRPCRQHL